MNCCMGRCSIITIAPLLKDPACRSLYLVIIACICRCTIYLPRKNSQLCYNTRSCKILFLDFCIDRGTSHQFFSPLELQYALWGITLPTKTGLIPVERKSCKIVGTCCLEQIFQLDGDADPAISSSIYQSLRLEPAFHHYHILL